MQNNPAKTQPIRIFLFGDFRIQVGDLCIRDTISRTHQLWHLLEYLVTFRHRGVSQEELAEALWPRREIDNPVNALKNLVYRARSLLGKQGLPYAKELILYRDGGYCWNNALPCKVDTEEFDAAYEAARAESLPPAQRLPHYRRMLALYQDDFLPRSRFEAWVVPIAGQYRSRYFEAVRIILQTLQEQARYEEMEQVCRRALQIDRFAEEVHQSLIVALVAQRRHEDAMEHYNALTDLYFRELAVTPAAQTRSLYRMIAKKDHDVEMDLGIIKEDLREGDRIEGAFYCDYEVFRNLYRLEARTAARTGQPVFVSLLTVDVAGEKPRKLINRLMDSLHESIQGNLRKGDVFSRFSTSQYVLLLPAICYENCEMVTQRIVRHFCGANRSRTVALYAASQPLDPAE